MPQSEDLGIYVPQALGCRGSGNIGKGTVGIGFLLKQNVRTRAPKLFELIAEVIVEKCLFFECKYKFRKAPAHAGAGGSFRGVPFRGSLLEGQSPRGGEQGQLSRRPPHFLEVFPLSCRVLRALWGC